MSKKTQDEDAAGDALAVSRALADEMTVRGVSSEVIADATGITASHIRKMRNGQQEPKLSVISKIERDMGWERGCIVRRLYDFGNVERMLRTDDTLIPVLRDSCADNYLSCQRLSSESFNN